MVLDEILQVYRVVAAPQPHTTLEQNIFITVETLLENCLKKITLDALWYFQMDVVDLDIQ